MSGTAVSLDALSELTRKERQYLLVASGIGIIVATTGFVPTKIQALGIEFSEANRGVLLKCLAGIVGYFLVSFLIYAADDFVAVRQMGYSRFVDKVVMPNEENRAKLRVAARVKSLRGYKFFAKSHRCLRWVRLIWDFMFPVISAAYACYVLWTVQT